jgi:hypothetical protein
MSGPVRVCVIMFETSTVDVYLAEIIDPPPLNLTSF